MAFTLNTRGCCTCLETDQGGPKQDVIDSRNEVISFERDIHCESSATKEA